MKGVYKITNIITNKFYIGSSNNIQERIKTHFRGLKNNRHPNKHLQSSYNKYGKDNFIVDILEECQDIIAREQYYIDINNWNMLYNKTRYASGGEANFWLYKFEGEEKVDYDFNWEYLLFVIPLSNLSHIMERYLEEVEKIEKKRQSEYNRYKEEHFKEEITKPADINLYDIARADIKNQSNKLD